MSQQSTFYLARAAEERAKSARFRPRQCSRRPSCAPPPPGTRLPPDRSRPTGCARPKSFAKPRSRPKRPPPPPTRTAAPVIPRPAPPSFSHRIHVARRPCLRGRDDEFARPLSAWIVDVDFPPAERDPLVARPLCSVSADFGGASSRKMATTRLPGSLANGLSETTCAISAALRTITPTGLPA